MAPAWTLDFVTLVQDTPHMLKRWFAVTFFSVRVINALPNDVVTSNSATNSVNWTILFYLFMAFLLVCIWNSLDLTFYGARKLNNF